MSDNSGLLTVVHYVHLQSLEMKDQHVHCYYVRTLYKTIAIRAAFVIYAWHRVAVVTPWTTTKYPCGFDGTEGLGGVFFFLQRDSLPPNLKSSSKWNRRQKYTFWPKRELKTDLKCTILFCTLWKTLGSERLIKNTVASLWSSSQIAAEL